MIDAMNNRQFPKKQFRVKLAYGPYQKGAIVEPTGVYRDMLLSKGIIEPMPVAAPAPSQGALLEAAPLNRRRK